MNRVDVSFLLMTDEVFFLASAMGIEKTYGFDTDSSFDSAESDNLEIIHRLWKKTVLQGDEKPLRIDAALRVVLESVFNAKTLILVDRRVGEEWVSHAQIYRDGRIGVLVQKDPFMANRYQFTPLEDFARVFALISLPVVPAEISDYRMKCMDLSTGIPRICREASEDWTTFLGKVDGR